MRGINLELAFSQNLHFAAQGLQHLTHNVHVLKLRHFF